MEASPSPASPCYRKWTNAARQDDGLLEWLDLKSRSGLTSLGKLLNKYEGRDLSDAILNIPPGMKNNAQHRFFKPQNAPEEGTSGTFSSATHSDEKSQLPKVIEKEEVGYRALAEVPFVPDVPSPVESATEFALIAEEIASGEGPRALDMETYNELGGAGAISPFALVARPN